MLVWIICDQKHASCSDRFGSITMRSHSHIALDRPALDTSESLTQIKASVLLENPASSASIVQDDYGLEKGSPLSLLHHDATYVNKRRPMRRSSLVNSSSHHQTPEEIEYRQERRRHASLTFDESTNQVQEIPRYPEESKAYLFYDATELNLMRCDASMRRSGMDPTSFDWRSFRWYLQNRSLRKYIRSYMRRTS